MNIEWISEVYQHYQPRPPAISLATVRGHNCGRLIGWLYCLIVTGKMLPLSCPMSGSSVRTIGQNNGTKFHPAEPQTAASHHNPLNNQPMHGHLQVKGLQVPNSSIENKTNFSCHNAILLEIIYSLYFYWYFITEYTNLIIIVKSQ